MDSLKVRDREMLLEKAREALYCRGYQIARLLGEGAFSQVVLIRKKNGIQIQRYAEESCAMQKWYAPCGMACKISNQTDLALREAETLARTAHPLFPEFFGMWQEGETVFLLMEYICGSSLEALINRRGTFSEAQTVRMGLEIAEGLKYLHELPKPILFRDVKPANILIRQDGRVKLLDLGCACGTGERANLAGTPEYAAPEQLQSGSAVTPACDVYGLGKTLQAMVGENCGRKLKKVIAACLREQPEERIPDMRGVIEALAALRGESGRRQRQNSGLFHPHIVCEKNIWESAHKSSYAK